MNKLFLSIITFLSLFETSCVNNERLPESMCDLEAKDSVISIKIGSAISPVTQNIRYFVENTIEYLAIQSNNNSQKISIYNLHNGNHVKDIIPEREGNNGVGKMLGFDIINFDSIFLTSNSYYNFLFIIDSSSTVVNKIDFEIGEGPFLRTTLLRSCFGDKIYLLDENIIVHRIYMDDDDGFKKLQNYSVGFIFNIKSNKTNLYPLNYPDISITKDKILNSMSNLIINKKNLIISYSLGNEIFVSSNKGSYKSYTIKSKYINSKLKGFGSNDMLESVKKFVEGSHYMSLVFDSYRNVYYRFVYPGIEVNTSSNLMALNEFKQIFSIMIVDENFNIIGETLMPENTYNPNMFFINKDGLWISLNHINNPNFDPDFIKFQLFNFNK